MCLLPFWGAAGFLRRDRLPKRQLCFHPQGWDSRSSKIASRKRTLGHCRKLFSFSLQGGVTGSHLSSAYSYMDSHASVLYLGKMKYRKNEQFDHTFSFLCRHRMVRFRRCDLYEVTPVSPPLLLISLPLQPTLRNFPMDLQ